MANTYLARKQKIFGPFSQAELDLLHQKGEIGQFTWIWDAKNETWKPLDPAPSAPPPSKGESVAPPACITDLRVLCHDFQTAVSGTIHEATETGCVLITQTHAPPSFATQSPIHLNLLNLKSGELVNCAAKLQSITRDETAGGWRLMIRWDARPPLL